MNRLILIAFLLLCSGCDTVKNIFRQKESIQTTTTNETSTSNRTETFTNWIRNGSSLLSRDGTTHIEFEGHATIDIGTDDQIRATGNSPKISRTTSETRQDTTSEVRDTRSIRGYEEKSKSTADTSEKKKVLGKQKEVKSQKIAPILIIIFLILALFLAGKFFKLI